MNKLSMSIRYIILLSSILFLASCGGGGGGGGDGGGGDSTPSEQFQINSTQLRQYQNNESLSYSANISLQHYDSSGNLSTGNTSANISVTFLTGYTTSDAGWDLINPLTKRIDTTTIDSTQITTQSFFHYSQNGDYVQFWNGNNNYHSNQAIPTDGIFRFPGDFFNGLSWITYFDMYEFDDNLYYLPVNYTVLLTETIDVAGSRYDTYKVIFNGSGGMYILTLSGQQVSDTITLDISGTMWINPEIGIIKRVTTYIYTKSNWVLKDTLNETIQLENFNFTL